MAPVESMLRIIFCARAGFHAGGPGDDFGADLGDDLDVGGLAERGFRIADDRYGFCAVRAGVFEGGDGEGSASAGSDADHDIFLA